MQQGICERGSAGSALSAVSRGCVPRRGGTDREAANSRKRKAANSTKQSHVSKHPVTANAANGGPAFCDPQGHCTPAAAPAPSAPLSQSKSSSCGGLSVGPGATAIGEESCPHPSAPKIGSAPPPGAIGPTTSVNGKTVACFNYNSAHQVIPSDCSTQGEFIFTPNSDDAGPQPAPSEAATQPSASAPASSLQASPVHFKNVSQRRNECPELDRNGQPCIRGTKGSEQQGDWTIYRVDITNSCECTCAVDGTDDTGHRGGDIAKPYSSTARITCIHTALGGCTGFKDDLSYTCHR